MNPTDYIDICEERHGGAANSVAANEAVAPSKAQQRGRILRLLAERPGLCCEAIEAALDLKHQTASARVSELKRDGLIAVIGRTKTSSGCSAAMYQVVEKEA